MVSLSRPKEVRSQETSMPARLPATSSVERNRPRLSGPSGLSGWSGLFGLFGLSCLSGLSRLSRLFG
jgi:hypothetical protein